MPFPRVALALAAGLAACTPALNWREVRLEPVTAVALLPCKPDRVMRRVPLGGVPTDLAVAGCEADGVTFAVMAASVPAGRAPDELLAGWQQATLANMQAAEAGIARQPFRPAGGLPLAHAQRVGAPGRRADGRPVAAQAVWTARAAPGGGTELLHAVVYADRPRPDVADAFFAGIRWP
ncbi:hypothetical protein [Ottowia sp.]|jgi:hypothetical protein|uniref:hypothetical protein n=1 Tax=Ottowia sp. TaxID=1898956 RepID=UPI0025CCB91A|nr:hypothetical protein [Ottowia sp.]MBK6615192.1 hypothetical protein [Ottowia sp.]MBK6746268.1 hypothetical protein [Ottowia sp.]